MSILDTFFVLYQTNAKQAEKETRDFDKSQKDLEKDLKATDIAAKSLGDTVYGLANAAVGFAAAFVSFNSIKNGMREAANFNAEIGKQTKLIPVSASKISAWGGILQQVGGTTEEFTGWLANLNKQYQLVGQGDRVPQAVENLLVLSDEMAKLNHNDAVALARRYDLTDNMIVALLKGRTEIERLMAQQAQLAPLTEKDTQAALDFKAAWENVTISLRGMYTELDSHTLPILTKVLNFFNEPFEIPDWLAKITPDFLKVPNPGAKSRRQTSQSNEEQSRSFWASQGYTPAQISGLIANEKSESNFNNGAIGDGGRARGIFQWHPDRRAAILNGTGIDVATASHGDQLKAAAWELEQRGDAARLRQTSTAYEAGSLISSRFERPDNGIYKAFVRGQMAQSDYSNSLLGSAKSGLGIADSSPYSSSIKNQSSNVSIGSITVNTQATDADGIAAAIDQHLIRHLGVATGNANDGITY